MCILDKILEMIIQNYVKEFILRPGDFVPKPLEAYTSAEIRFSSVTLMLAACSVSLYVRAANVSRLIPKKAKESGKI